MESEVGGRFKKEGIYVCLWLNHVEAETPILWPPDAKN